MLPRTPAFQDHRAHDRAGGGRRRRRAARVCAYRCVALEAGSRRIRRAGPPASDHGATTGRSLWDDLLHLKDEGIVGVGRHRGLCLRRPCGTGAALPAGPDAVAAEPARPTPADQRRPWTRSPDAAWSCTCARCPCTACWSSKAGLQPTRPSPFHHRCRGVQRVLKEAGCGSRCRRRWPSPSPDLRRRAWWSDVGSPAELRAVVKAAARRPARSWTGALCGWTPLCAMNPALCRAA